MFRRLGLVLAALALFGVAGGQFGVVQSVAWARMLRDYTRQTGSIQQAVAQTFDGQHPCELCLAIEAARTAEKPTDQTRSEPTTKFAKAKKSDQGALCEPAPGLPRDIAVSANWAALAPLDWTARGERPPTPPPRA